MASPPRCELSGISKRFLGVTANDAVDFRVAPGEICALLGENGAGKTTLMNILFGYYRPDEGTIRVDGREHSFAAPRDAIRAGIGMVHQHFTLVPPHTVLENIIIGTREGGRFLLHRAAARKRLAALQERFGLRVDPDRPVAELSVGERQRVEILKALYRDSSVLILDEPTAVLGPQEVEGLFHTLRLLAEEGRSVIFISHKLNEVMEIADRVVVLRGGKVADERRVADTSARELAQLMVGREVLERIERPAVEPGATVLAVENLRLTDRQGVPLLDGVDLHVAAREIVGVAGVAGNGQREFCEVLFGLRVPTAGTVRIGDEAFPLGRPRAAEEAGMARIPEDRMGAGLLVDLTVAENLVLNRYDQAPVGSGILYHHARAEEYARERVEAYGVKTRGVDQVARLLSGGNLQKLILARELDGEPRVVVAAQPTRGLDVGAMEYVHQRILDQKGRGAAVVLVSDDLDEILQLADRIVVFYEGCPIGEMPAAEADREKLGLLMSGVAA